MWNKNAQAAAAIIIVAVLLLGYLILMPPKDKCQIFPDSQSCKNATEIEGKTLLLSETPGLLQPIEESAEYKISAIDLFNRENTEVPVKLDAEAVIEKSWFNSKTIEEEFELE